VELFGTPLNQVPRPHKPFQVKMWHVGLGIGISILLYKGIEKLFEDVFKGSKNKFMSPIKLKE
jgi:hypothetical protein